MSILHAIIIVGLFAAYFTVTLDTSKLDGIKAEISAADAGISAGKDKLVLAAKNEREFEEKKKQYADLVKQLQASQGALPKDFFLPDLLSDILREGKKLELDITSIVPDAQETKAEFYSTLGFTVDVKGTFLQVFVFLDRLASLPRLVGVSSMSLQRDDEKPRVVLGGAYGAFGRSKLEGGTTEYTGVKSQVKILTYRYNK